VFAGLSLKKKFVALESTSFVMFLAMAIFALFMLQGIVESEKENVERLKQDILVMQHISTMDIAFLKQTKHAKNVWMRGADPVKKQKYRASFLEEQARFEKSLDAAQQGLQWPTSTSTPRWGLARSSSTGSRSWGCTPRSSRPSSVSSRTASPGARTAW